MKRYNHDCERVIPGYPMGSGEEHLVERQLRPVGRLTDLSAPKPWPLGPSGHPALAGRTLLSFPSTLTEQGELPPSCCYLSPKLGWGFHQPVVAADFPMACTRSTPVFFPAFDLPQGKRLQSLVL